MFGGPIHDYWEPSQTPASRSLIDRMSEAGRQEAAASAARLDAIGELFELRRVERGEAKDYAVDTWAAVGAEVAAAFRISLALAGSYMRYALAMRDRLPLTAQVFRAGEIDYRVFQTLVYRTDLITDEAALTAVDAQLAARVGRWPSMTQSRLATVIDRLVAKIDPDAVRRTRERAKDREVQVWETEPGMADVGGTLFATDAQVLDKRLDALAETVCMADPRTRQQRRADALGALAAGADLLACRCGRSDCEAGGPTASNVVVHVVAEQATVEGRSDAPGYLAGADQLIPAELVAELAETAKLRPLFDAAVADPEPGYRPSAQLAEFVRARDLTCRAPGCDRPAAECDIDHTIAFSDGGPTHASNLKCACRTHHLLKTFWGWRDEQLPDGTVIWRLPSGQTHVTTPGSALLFPSLCVPTGGLSATNPARADRRGDPAVNMPKRKTTRAQNRARYIQAERRRNRQLRQAAIAEQRRREHARIIANDEPPPF